MTHIVTNRLQRFSLFVAKRFYTGKVCAEISLFVRKFTYLITNNLLLVLLVKKVYSATISQHTLEFTAEMFPVDRFLVSNAAHSQLQ